MQLRNDSPVGDLDIPLLRRVVLAGEVFDVTAEQANILLDQCPYNFGPADDEAKAVLDAKTATEDSEGGDQ